jgi:hypothetical protein
MLFLFLLYYLLTIRAMPVPKIKDSEVTTACDNIHDCRTLEDIVWSCVTTIFLCTWVSLHPDISKPINKKDDRIWKKLGRFVSGKLVSFLSALLIPELILNWALGQRKTANNITRKNRK